MLDSHPTLALFGEFVRVTSPPGREERFADLVRAKVESAGYDHETDPAGNVTVVIPGAKPDLPTVVYAYPLEYSGAATAGQVRGSAQRFNRFQGASHLFFLLRGYAVLDRTAMPMIGDPETTYDTFVPQLVADAEAALAKAVEIGVADPERIGVIGQRIQALEQVFIGIRHTVVVIIRIGVVSYSIVIRIDRFGSILG